MSPEKDDPIVDPDLDIEPDLTPEEEEQVGTESLFDTEQMPAEESVEHQSEPDRESVEDSSDWAEDKDYGWPEEGLKEPGIDETMNTELAHPPVIATLLVVGSAEWELDITVWQAISNWQARHGVTQLTIATTGCPTGAEAAARRHPHAAAFGHTVIRDEDIGRLGLTAALFFIRDYSQGAERLLDAAKASRLAVTVYREESTEDNSPWRNH